MPLQIAGAIFQCAKLRMLQFYYDFLVKYNDRADFKQRTARSFHALRKKSEDCQTSRPVPGPCTFAFANIEGFQREWEKGRYTLFVKPQIGK